MAFLTAPTNTPTMQDPLAHMSALERIMLGLGGSSAVDGAIKQGRETAMQSAMQDIAQRMQSGELDQKSALLEYARRTGDYSKMFQADATPAAIREYEYVSKLAPEEQALYFRNKRANQMFDRGDAQVVLDAQGQPVATYDKQLSPEQRPQTKEEQAAASARGQAAGEATAQAPGKIADADMMLKTIDDVLGDKEGLNAATGGMFGIQGRVSDITGGLGANQRRAQPKIDQLQGQAFLQAFNNLKGGGQITEVEGTKAENAIARLSQAQETKDFEKALLDLRDVVVAAKERVAKAGRGAPSTPTAPTAPSAPSAPGGSVIDFGSLK